jgi:hypothetical protein
MLRLIATASLLALSGAAVAQSTETAPQEMPTTGPAPSTEVPAEAPPSETPPTESAPPAGSAPTEPAPSTAAPSREDTVKQVVEAEFSTYDADKNGELSKTEFTEWVTKLRQNSLASQGKPPVPDTEMQEWAKNAFAKSDSDKSKTVSKTELETFLMG